MSTDDERRAALRHLLGRRDDDPADDPPAEPEPEPTGMRAFLRTLNTNPTD